MLISILACSLGFHAITFELIQDLEPSLQSSRFRNVNQLGLERVCHASGMAIRTLARMRART